MIKKFSNPNFGPLLASLIIFIIVLMTVVMPAFTQAQGFDLIPCDGIECDWDDLVKLGSNVITFLLLLSIPLATIAFAWAGVLMLTAAGKEEQVSQAKSIFWMVLKGFLFALTAWLLVRMITTVLLDENNYEDLLSQMPAIRKEIAHNWQDLS